MHGHENDATVTHHDSWLIMIHQLTSLHLRYIFVSSTWPRIRTSCAITLAAMNANCAWLSIPTKDVDQRLQREQRHPVTSSHIQSHPHGGGTFTDSQIVDHVLSCVQLSCQLNFTSVFLKSGDRRQCWNIWQEVTWHTPRARSIRSILRDEQRERSRCRDRHVVIVLSSLYRILWQIPGDDCDVVILLTCCHAHAILDFGGRNNSASATNIFRHDVFCKCIQESMVTIGRSQFRIQVHGRLWRLDDLVIEWPRTWFVKFLKFKRDPTDGRRLQRNVFVTSGLDMCPSHSCHSLVWKSKIWLQCSLCKIFTPLCSKCCTGIAWLYYLQILSPYNVFSDMKCVEIHSLDVFRCTKVP